MALYGRYLHVLDPGMTIDMRHLYTGQEKGMISTSLLGFRSIAGEKSHIYLQVLLAYALGVAQNNFLIYVG